MKNLSTAKEELKQVEKSLKISLQLDFQEFREEINEKLDKKFGLMPNKDEFFGWMDKLMKELTAIREEHTISGYHLKDHEDRISLLEQKTGLATV